ncbi:MAG: hypothetical protein ABIV25_10800, partial [Paracoccaceae bacterium]
DFIVFDDDFSTWMTYSTDRPLVIISRCENCGASADIAGISDTFWREYFSDNINAAAKGSSSNYVELFNKIFLPRLPGFSEISAKHEIRLHSS